MPNPVAICLEAINSTSDSSRFTQCVVITGADTGLGLDDQGSTTWLENDTTAVEFFISADDRVMAMKTEICQVPVTISRAGRSVAPPAGKPVVLLSGDRISLGDRAFIIHFHGGAEVIHEPVPFIPEPHEVRDQSAATPLGKVASYAAVAALGAMISASGCTGNNNKTQTTGEGKDPMTSPMLPDAMGVKNTGDATAIPVEPTDPMSSMTPVKPKPPMIEVRDHPPKPVRRPD
ncbi:hypothetical protein KKF84_02165 [Myxococcota bacterium]|nr:hypothetical protein [Myxococcota bacterium]MBU1534092.1 hypothetical protein [Myxococcota bacterium]